MGIEFTTDTATLQGNCRVDDAEPLRAWLALTPQGRVDLVACEKLHTAIWQVLLAARPEIVQLPTDSFLRHLLQDLHE